MSVTIRAYTSDDLAPVHDLIVRTICACYTDHYAPSAVEHFMDHHAPDRITRDAVSGHTLVAERDALVVGTGTLVGQEIRRLFVDPSAQRAGVGRMLMGELENRARGDGISRVELDVSTVSREFYVRLGYEYVTAEAIVAEMPDGEGLAYYQMVKQL